MQCIIANGARIYYLNRSQPPLLSEMVKVYIKKTGDIEFLDTALPILDKEYEYWSTETIVTLGDTATGERHTLNRYNVITNTPRPESYVEDYEAAYRDIDLNETQIHELFSNLATGAETGWDYSSRWTRLKAAQDKEHGYDILRSLNTRNVIPVDLNAILYNMEVTLSEWHKNDNPKSEFYARQAQKRLVAIDKFLWNSDKYAFYDYNLTSQTQNIEYTPAGLFPFW